MNEANLRCAGMM